MVKVLVKQNKRSNIIHCNTKRSARPFIVSVPAVVSVVLFDQILDQKLTWSGLGWPGSNPGLAQVKPWAGPRSSPGLGPGKMGPVTTQMSCVCLDGGFRTGDQIDTAIFWGVLALTKRSKPILGVASQLRNGGTHFAQPFANTKRSNPFLVEQN